MITWLTCSSFPFNEETGENFYYRARTGWVKRFIPVLVTLRSVSCPKSFHFTRENNVFVTLPARVPSFRKGYHHSTVKGLKGEIKLPTPLKDKKKMDMIASLQPFQDPKLWKEKISLLISCLEPPLLLFRSLSP